MTTCLKRKIYIIFFIFFVSGSNLMCSYAPVNFNKPYDVNYWMNDWYNGKKRELLKIGCSAEYGTTKKSRNYSGDSVDLLSLYQNTQSSLAMLLGADSGSDIDNFGKDLLDDINYPEVDDSYRGNFKVYARYHELDCNLFTQLNFHFESIPGKFDITAYAPIRYMAIKNVNWVDQTRGVSSADDMVQADLTDNLATNVMTLGDLNIGDWSKTGLGDLAFILRWYHDFIQYKRNIDKVRLTGRLGITVPTGAKKNEDITFSQPLGYDGSVSVPITFGLDIYFKCKLRFGLELELTSIFDDTRVRRLKTNANQTDYLLLQKGEARKSYGTTWKFNLCLVYEHFLGGLSGRFAYQYFRHNDDDLHVKSQGFSDDIVNTAQSLKDRTFHNFIFQLNYDFFKEAKRSVIKPQLCVFYKLPVAGRRSFMSHTIGGEIAFNF